MACEAESNPVTLGTFASAEAASRCGKGGPHVPDHGHPCDSRTDPTPSARLSVLYSIATLPSSNVRMRWRSSPAVVALTCQCGARIVVTVAARYHQGAPIFRSASCTILSNDLTASPTKIPQSA